MKILIEIPIRFLLAYIGSNDNAVAPQKLNTDK